MSALDGYRLSDAALYSFKCQDVYPDLVSFATAIPDHLKPIFLIPSTSRSMYACSHVAMIRRVADGAVPTGNTPEGDLFSYNTFNHNDNESTIPSSDPGSIFETDGADNKTHHQEYNFDQNIQSPSDTSYMTDVDLSDIQKYPYRLNEKDIRKSSTNQVPVLIVRIAKSPKFLELRTPTKIRDNAETCTVELASYEGNSRLFTFKAKSSDGDGSYIVQLGLMDPDNVVLSCTCPFWRWNGPDYHAKNNDYLSGEPKGTASKPEKRDPNGDFWLCKHTFAVIKRFDEFLDIVEKENEDKGVMDSVDDQWDRLEGAAEVPLTDIDGPEEKLLEDPEEARKIIDESELDKDELDEEPVEEPLDVDQSPDEEIPEEEIQEIVNEHEEESKQKPEWSKAFKSFIDKLKRLFG